MNTIFSICLFSYLIKTGYHNVCIIYGKKFNFFAKLKEFFRKLLEDFIVKNPQFKQCQEVDHLVQEVVARQTVYNALNRRKNDQSIVCDTHLGPPSSWTKIFKAIVTRHEKVF
jgi:hypothetical protein